MRYGLIHERGGVIRAKGKALPVPVNIAARRLLENGVSLRTLKMHVIKRPGRDSLLVGDNKVSAIRMVGKHKMNFTEQPVFVLKKSITLKPRPWAAPVVAMGSRSREKIREEAIAAAEKVLKKSAKSAVRGRM